MASTKWILAGDIGGTKTRLGLFRPGKKRPVLKAEEVFASSDAPDLESIVTKFFGKHRQPVGNACFGVAGPVEAGRALLTNLPWKVSETRLRQRLKIKNVRLINDLSAVAHALPGLRNTDWIGLNRGRRKIHGPVGIIAPGTGLGMALMVEQEGQRVIVPSEGGHADFAPTTMEQCDLWQFLHERCGHVSIERVLSGPGIFNIYRWLKESGRFSEPQWLRDTLKTEDPARIIFGNATSQLQPEKICTETLRIFVSVLGSVAGNLALTGLTGGGIYIAGGIAPRIQEELRDESFRLSFIGKGRFKKQLKNTPVRLILNTNLPLLGAAAHACKYL
jgi:glucokinase